MFGRHKHRAGEDPDDGYEQDGLDTEADEDFADDEDYDDEDTYDELEEAEPEQAADSYGETGPFDLAEAPDDEVPRIDLGCVRVPVPDGAQLQVEMDPEDNGVRAVHLLTSAGQFTMNAYAAPRSGGLWPEVASELADQLRSDGATVERVDGEWGEELVGAVNDVALRFIGVDGPRWLLRGVVAGPRDSAEDSARELTEIVRDTVVVRGDSPMPVRTPLPMELPAEIAEQVQQAQEA
jgi:hypothetical protein